MLRFTGVRAALFPAVLAVAASVVPCLRVAALPASPPLTRMEFEAFKHGQGFGNQTVNLLLQDREGFIWAGTERGLFRYDGFRFELFDGSRGLPELLAKALCLDAEGGLWVATDARLARLKGDGFVTIMKGLPAGVSISDLAAGRGGELWVATNKGLFAGSETAGFRPVPGWGDAVALAVFYAPRSGRVWAVGTEDLWRLDPGGSWTVVDRGGAASREGLERVFEDDHGRVWIRTASSMWEIEPGGTRPRVADALYRSENEISRMYQDANGVLWVPDETGLGRLEKGRWTQWEARDGLPTDFSRAALVDHEGSLWVGGLGLFRILGRGAWRSATPNEGLPAPAWTFLRTDDGNLWVGTQKGLFRQTPKGWEVVPGTEGLCVRALCRSADGTLFMTGEPAGILAWDPVKKKAAALPETPVRGSWVFGMLLEGEDRLWIATAEAGLASARKLGGAWRTQAEPLPGGSGTEAIYSIIRDRAGRLWAGGDNGLACFSEGRWARFTKKDGLRDTPVTFVVEAPTGDLWVAYYEKLGVSRVRLENGRLRVLQNIGPAEGLPDIDIYLIGLDAKGRLWLGSEKGVEVIEKPHLASGRRLHFGLAEGLPDEDTATMAFLADPNGDVWIGTRSGIGRYVAALDGGPPPPPRTVILRASLGGRPIPTASGRPVRVPYRSNELDASFSAPTFIAGGAVEHEFRFLGLEDRWIGVKEREVHYPGLRPGGYKLEIRSRSGGGDWGPAAALEFAILPPLWQTPLARAGAFVVVLALFYFLINLRTRNLKKRAGSLEAQVESRTAELAARTRELADANESLRTLSLTDTLTGLRNRRFLKLTMPEYLAQVDRAHTRSETAPREAPANIDMMLAMLDVDHFKRVNDEYGHDAGDRVLVQIAALLRTAVRDTDTVARWGGEEFLLVMRNSCRAEGHVIAERVRNLVASHPFELGDGRVIHCTCCIGFAFYPFLGGHPRSFGWETVVVMADRCLIAAKRSGRDTWVGLSAPEGADPDLLKRRLPADLGGLVRSGLLRPTTSLRDPVAIVWGPK